jgi:hypothetical protein
VFASALAETAQFRATLLKQSLSSCAGWNFFRLQLQVVVKQRTTWMKLVVTASAVGVRCSSKAVAQDRKMARD